MKSGSVRFKTYERFLTGGRQARDLHAASRTRSARTRATRSAAGKAPAAHRSLPRARGKKKPSPPLLLTVLFAPPAQIGNLSVVVSYCRRGALGALACCVALLALAAPPRDGRPQRAGSLVKVAGRRQRRAAADLQGRPVQRHPRAERHRVRRDGPEAEGRRLDHPHAPGPGLHERHGPARGRDPPAPRRLAEHERARTRPSPGLPERFFAAGEEKTIMSPAEGLRLRVQGAATSGCSTT